MCEIKYIIFFLMDRDFGYKMGNFYECLKGLCLYFLALVALALIGAGI